MIFRYRYQDKGRGVLESEITASSQSDAYSLLRKRGVRPMKVWPKPGFANRLSAIGKRGWAIVILALALVATICHSAVRIRASVPPPVSSLAPIPRQQIAKTDVSFSFNAERTLAAFARPGDLTELASATNDPDAAFSDLAESLKKPMTFGEGESDEAILLKRIVAGMKIDAQMAIAGGRGTVGLLDFLLSRQKMEALFRETTLQGVRRKPSSLKEANEVLRNAGLAEIEKGEL